MVEEEVKEEEGEEVEGRGKYLIVVKLQDLQRVVHRGRLRLLVLTMNPRRALRIVPRMVPRVVVVVVGGLEEEEEGVEVLVGEEEEEEGQAQARAVDMSPMATATVMALPRLRP